MQRKMLAISAMLAQGLGPMPPSIYFWNLTRALAEQGLSYEEQATALAFQGLVNRKDDIPQLFVDSGNLDFDWPKADRFWREMLVTSGRATFKTVAPTLCGLITGADANKRVRGVVVYDDTATNTTDTCDTTVKQRDCSPTPGKFWPNATQHTCTKLGCCWHPGGIKPTGHFCIKKETGTPRFGDGYSLALALTLASQHALLPVTPAALNRHSCLGHLTVVADIRKLPISNRASAWRYAIDNLLANASRSVIYNLNRWRTEDDPESAKTDPQSPATASTIDYAVQQGAFVMDLETRVSDADHKGQGAHRPQHLDDEAIIEEIYHTHMEPLFSAYGWGNYEYSWTNITSVFGGTVMCSFATPSLSFWSIMPCDTSGRNTSRPLPHNDRGMALNRSKFYVTFEVRAVTRSICIIRPCMYIVPHT